MDLGPGKDVQDTKRCGPDMWKFLSEATNESKRKMDYRETKAQQCQTIERNILYCTKRRRIQTHDESRSQKVGSSNASSNALQNTEKEQWKPTAALENARRNTLVMLMPTKARDQGMKEQDTNLIKITSLQIRRQSSSHATERWKPWPVNDSHGETCRHRRGIRGMWIFPNLKLERRRCDRETGCTFSAGSQNFCIQ